MRHETEQDGGKIENENWLEGLGRWKETRRRGIAGRMKRGFGNQKSIAQVNDERKREDAWGGYRRIASMEALRENSRIGRRESVRRTY